MKFQSFKKFDNLSDMLPRIYATAKAHQFLSIYSVNINDLKFRPITD